MGMTIDKCANMLTAKENCIEHETSGIDTDCNSHNCNDCSLCYEQGTMREQKEALIFAVETMRKYQKIEQIMERTVDDGTSMYDTLQEIEEVVEDGSENNNYAPNC